MNNSDFKEAAERYKNEMIALYGAKAKESTETMETKSEEAEPVNKNITENENIENNESEEEIQNNTENESDPENNIEAPIQEITDDEIEKRFPPPVIPDFIKNSESKVENDSFGFLKISVRTGSGGIPIEGSTVIVSQTVDGEEKIIKLMNTNSSGDTETLKLPAPKKPSGNSPQDFAQFSTYNISAFSEGYFREASKDAPIFEGITSIQTFFLVPEPFNYDSNADTINYQNEEPII